MVYCGKASQGCQNCRTRRIKCDKLRPDCSQCIRVGKKCPGYRDQLSLMFRDESSKVIQKAHAQWGVGEGPDDAVSVSPSNSTSSYSPITPASRRASPEALQLTHPRRSSSSSSSSSSSTSTTSLVRIRPPIVPTFEEQGAHFFINRYIIGHPDEPRTPEEFKSADWATDPALRDVMTAVGLAGLSNLKDDNRRDLMLLARERYGMALRQTGQLVQSRRGPSLEVTMRAIVTLAMFELVKGENLNIDNVHVHILGGVALMQSWCPLPEMMTKGIRGLIQLSYTMFVSAHMTGTTLPPAFHEWIRFSRSLQSDVDAPSIDLGVLIAKFVDLSSAVRHTAFQDGQASTTSMIQQLVSVEQELANWEQGLQGLWLYRVAQAPQFPSEAVFQGEYHTYHDMWFARMWNHYRWARLLANQTIIELMDKNPISSSFIVFPDRNQRIEVIHTLARDIMISIPTHWRHPLLGDRMPLPVERQGAAGSGAAGIIIVIFQLKTAACSINIPDEYWMWIQELLRCIWRDMGMLHAKNMMQEMESHRARVQRSQGQLSVVA